MLRSLTKYVHVSLLSGNKKTNPLRGAIPALQLTSSKKSTAVCNIFVNQYIRTCSTKKGRSDKSKSRKSPSGSIGVPNLPPSEEMMKYKKLYNLINNIEKDSSAVYLGELAEETGLVDPKWYSIERLERAMKEIEDKVDPDYAPIQSAVKGAYKSFKNNFAFDLGSMLSDFDLHIRIADGKLVNCGEVGSNLKSEMLKKHCVPAPYGDLKSMTTKVNPEVRSAWTIDYNKIVIKKIKEESYLWGSKKADPISVDTMQEDPEYRKALNYLLSRVQEEFQDDTLYLEPYKLNMYEKGGFFKPHVDTPRYENMVGTMVVRLKDAYGGHLIVRHGGEIFTEDGQVTAFFSDREHEIKPVIEGVRISLTFNICRDNASVAKSDQAITLTRTTPLVKDHNIAGLIKAIKESPFKKVGLLTEFDYTQKGISLHSLKGNDRIVLEELSKEPSFKIDLIPTVVSMRYIDNTGLDEFPEKYDIRGKVYRLSNEDLERMMQGERAPKTKKKDEIAFFRVNDGVEVYKHEQKSAMHTGNECLEHTIDNIYFNGAIVVTDLNPKSTITSKEKMMQRIKNREKAPKE